MSYKLTIARYNKTKCELRHMTEFSQATSKGRYLGTAPTRKGAAALLL